MRPLDRLKHHVTGAIERGEAQPIVEQRPRRIHVKLDYHAKCWVASHYVADDAAPGGYSADPSVWDAFGTETIPTPFTLQADERTVLAEIRRLNPAAIVECV